MQFEWAIKLTDVVIVFAMLLSSFLALQAQKWLEQEKVIKERRMWIFRVLMATRAARLSPNHVETLNAVPIEFYGSNENLRASLINGNLTLPI